MTPADRERASSLSEPCNDKLPTLVKHGYLFPLLILLIFILELLKEVCWVSELLASDMSLIEALLLLQLISDGDQIAVYS